MQSLDLTRIHDPNLEDTPQVFCSGVIQAAQYYASRGLDVFPCQTIKLQGGQYVCSCGRPDCTHPGKHPATPNGYKDATRDPDMIQRWWTKNPNRNIGLVVGPEAGVVIVDVDPRNGGDAPWQRIIEEHPLPPDTLVAQTGGGGWHILVEYPQGQNGRKLPNKLAQGIDLRHKGYVIAPPGLHITGGLYRWQQGSKPAPWSWLEPLLGNADYSTQGPIEQPQQTEQTLTGKALAEEKRGAKIALLSAASNCLGAPTGTRNNMINKEAFAIGGLVGGGLLDRDEAYNELYKLASRVVVVNGTDEDFTEEELVRCINHGLDDGIKKPRWTVFPPKPSKVIPSIADTDEELLEVQGPGYDWLERSLARRQLEQIEAVSGVPIVFDRGDLYWHDPLLHYWTLLPEEKRYLHRAWHGVWDEKGKKRLDISADKSKGIIECCEQERIHTGFFNTRKPGVVVRNGRWVDGVLYPHDPDDRALFALSADWDPQATSPMYDAFLNRVVPDPLNQQILNEFMGAAILGITHLYKIALALVGPGNNGKSQWLNILTGFFPPTAFAAIPLHDLFHEYNSAKLANCSLNVVNEISDKDLHDTGALKQLIAGDPRDGRHPYGRGFTFLPRLALVFATNVLPPIYDQSEGFWSRFAAIEFGVTIPKDERIPDYGHRIFEAEAAGILRKALEGAQALQARGYLPESPKAEETKAEWRQRTDYGSRYVQEAVASQSDGKITMDELCCHHNEWCNNEGLQPLSKKMLGVKMAQAGHPSVVVRVGNTTRRIYRVRLIGCDWL